MALQIDRHRDLYEGFDIFMGSPQESALVACNIAIGYLEYKQLGPKSIYDTLSLYNRMEATGSRDRYFALAGICDLNALFVKYDKSYRDFACLVGKMIPLGFSEYVIGPAGDEKQVSKQSGNTHRFPIDWLAFYAKRRSRNLGLPTWIPDLISPRSTGFLMSGFYNTAYMQGFREIPSPTIHLRQGTSIVLACKRPPLPRPSCAEQGSGGINLNNSLEGVSQYETEMVYWLS